MSVWEFEKKNLLNLLKGAYVSSLEIDYDTGCCHDIETLSALQALCMVNLRYPMASPCKGQVMHLELSLCCHPELTFQQTIERSMKWDAKFSCVVKKCLDFWNLKRDRPWHLNHSYRPTIDCWMGSYPCCGIYTFVQSKEIWTWLNLCCYRPISPYPSEPPLQYKKLLSWYSNFHYKARLAMKMPITVIQETHCVTKTTFWRKNYIFNYVVCFPGRRHIYIETVPDYFTHSGWTPIHLIHEHYFLRPWIKVR